MRVGSRVSSGAPGPAPPRGPAQHLLRRRGMGNTGGGLHGVHFSASAPIGSYLTEVRVSVLFFKLLRLLRNKSMRHVSKSADGKIKLP